MKRRLLSAFLAVMMVLTMAPVAFAGNTATSDGEALSKLFTDVHAGESGSGNVTVTIDKDYDLTGYQWTSLTVQGYTGAGVVTVEGNNHKITGLNAPLFAGGFAGTSGIVVKNLTLTNVTINDSTSNQGIGAFINNVDSMPKIELDNCHLTDSSIVSNGGARVGGLIGWTSGYNNPNNGPVDTYVTIQNCSVENTKITAKGSVGGIIGHAGANPATYHTFTNNTVTGCTLNSTDDGGWRVGVVVGTANVGEVTITGTKESNNTLTQTGKTAPEGQSNLYGRFVPNGTGKLVIDDEASFGTDYVAAVGTNGYKTVAAAVAEADGKMVTLLKDVTENVVIPAGKTVTLDLNGNKIQAPTEPADKKYDAIDNAGTLTVKDSKKIGEIVSTRNSGIGVYANSKTTIDYANITGQEGAVGGSKTTVGATVTINDGVFKGIDNAVVIFNGTDRTGASNEITINGGTFNGQIKTEGYVACGIYAPWNDNITVNGGIFNITGGAGIVARAGNVTVKGGEFHTTGTAVGKVGDSRVVVPCSALVFDSAAKYPALTADSKITVTGGKFTSENGIAAIAAKDDDFTKRIVISGGLFSKEFDKSFCAVGLAVIDNTDESTKTEYPKTVGTLPANTENKIDAATDTGNNAVNADAITNSEDKNAAQDAAKKVKFEEAVADKNEITETDKQRGLTALANENKVQVDSNGKIQGNKTVTIVKEVFLDIAVTDFKVQGFEDKDVSVSMDITPKYNLIATTDKDNRTDENSVTLETKPLTVSEATKVSVTIPAFANKKVYIDHANGKNLYVATADENGKITFTTNGFSPFTFALTNPNVVAEVNGNAYKSLQDAVNAVENNGTIEIVGGNKDYTATISGSSKTIKVKNSLTDENIKVTVNGESKTIEPSKDATFTYTKPSSGSSGGSSSGQTTYKVTTSAVNNGGVNASPSSAEKGASITITLSPDKGYKLDKLTVTDGSGKTVSTVKKSDTVYTFTMPASAVKVGVSYVKATETPSETKFNDVSANDWFASAVDYVTGKGMMNGTADNTFSPKANTTRGMVVTVLYRLENQPSTSAASFTDVASGAYYANAVAWANANGIVSGYGSGKFGPNDKVTREQLAAILYRYAQYKKYDVSVGEDTNILSYDDAQSISSYAIPAIQWACGAGVVTGKSGSKLDSKGNATRAEVAAMLMRFCENVK